MGGQISNHLLWFAAGSGVELCFVCTDAVKPRLKHKWPYILRYRYILSIIRDGSSSCGRYHQTASDGKYSALGCVAASQKFRSDVEIRPDLEHNLHKLTITHAQTGDA